MEEIPTIGGVFSVEEFATSNLPTGGWLQSRGLSLDRLRDDDALIARYRAGDESAFAAIYTRYYRLVFAICLSVLSSRDDAADAAQDAFTSVAKQLGESSPENLKAWLGRIARNAAIDLLRMRKQATTLDAIEEPSSDSDSPERVTERRAEMRDLVRGIRDLPEEQRSALLMHELAGESYSEIAKSLKLTPDGVQSLIKRARIDLRSQRVGENTSCTTIREELAADLDRRKLSKEQRAHLHHCAGCREFDRALQKDRRRLRALVPPMGFLIFWRAGNALAATAKGVGIGSSGHTAVGVGATKLAAGAAATVVIGAGGAAIGVKSLESSSQNGKPESRAVSERTGAEASSVLSPVDLIERVLLGSEIVGGSDELSTGGDTPFSQMSVLVEEPGGDVNSVSSGGQTADQNGHGGGDSSSGGSGDSGSSGDSTEEQSSGSEQQGGSDQQSGQEDTRDQNQDATTPLETTPTVTEPEGGDNTQTTTTTTPGGQAESETLPSNTADGDTTTTKSATTTEAPQ